MLARFFEIHEHLLKSEAVAEVFTIRVLRPRETAKGGGRLAALYAGDADELFGGLATLAYSLQSSGATCPFVLVTIGYQRSELSQTLRLRDFLPDSIRGRLGAINQRAEEPLPVIEHTTDARQFLQFVREELTPFIERTYATRPDCRCYFGYSAGATFGLYTLFTEPGTFSRYILGSPSTSYDGHHFGIELAREFLASGRKLNAEVALSVGELEEFGPGAGRYQLVTGYYHMARFLMEMTGTDLRLTARVFPGETHATAWSRAFVEGAQQILGAGR